MSTDARDTDVSAWHKALDAGELPEGRVTTANCAGTTVCLTHYDGAYAAPDTNCPHQGGPLGEGKISKEQRDGGWPVWETDRTNPDFAAFADNCGAAAIGLNRPRRSMTPSRPT
jgi:hypothetical protein